MNQQRAKQTMKQYLTRRGVLQAGALSGFSVVTGCLNQFASDVSDGVEPTLIEADPDAGFNYPYFLYSPSIRTVEDRPLLVESNNTGTSTDDYARHKAEARDLVYGGPAYEISDTLRLPLLVPVFPRPRHGEYNWRYDPQQLDTNVMHIEEGPMKRIDRQLVRMIEDARSRLRDQSVPVSDAVHMNGFSASGLFANRFTALQPAVVDCITAGGINGHPILPIERAKGQTVNYQIGIADLESLTGEPFDREAFVEVSQFLYMGSEDQNDTFPHRDSWSEDQIEIAREVYGEDMIEDRFTYSQSVYEDIGADATFEVFEGVGHEVPERVRDAILEYHNSHLDEALQVRLAN